ncbi:MAG: hypothetical protein OXM55_07230 [Bdellovibrionales bacterium]|nr:hypothetical protein [Bdellovibrionales bacterium]
MKLLFYLLGTLFFYIYFAGADTGSLPGANDSVVEKSELSVGFQLYQSGVEFVDSNFHSSLGSRLQETQDSNEITINSLKQFLKQKNCEDSVIAFSFNTIKNSTLDIRIRDEIFKLSLEFCSEQESVIQKIMALALDSHLEWSLKEQAIIFIQNQQICSDEITDHLLQILYSPISWHIRNSVIWVLSDAPKGCDQRVISSLSELVHSYPFQGILAHDILKAFEYIDMDSIPTISNEMSDFLEAKIRSILWSLVRLGIRNNNITASVELKKIAMKADMNTYYRILAVEALQDLSLYVDSAAQALYALVRDSKIHLDPADYSYNYDYYNSLLKIAGTYYQTLQEKEDAKIRSRAFQALVELVEGDREKTLSFLFIAPGSGYTDSEVVRRNAMMDHPITTDLGLYARPVLIDLINDPRVEISQEYHQIATHVLN